MSITFLTIYHGETADTAVPITICAIPYIVEEVLDVLLQNLTPKEGKVLNIKQIATRTTLEALKTEINGSDHDTIA